MADNFVSNAGAGGSTFAADDVDSVLYPRVKLSHGIDGVALDATEATPLPVADSNSGSLLFRILQIMLSPFGYDRALGRYRQTAIIESGTINTVTTVGTVTAVGTVNSVAAFGAYQAGQQVYGQNQAAWSDCVRARIT